MKLSRISYRRLSYIISKRREFYIKLVLLFIIIFLIAGMGLYLLEHNNNENCSTFWKSLWAMTVYFLVGFENFGPITVGGRLISLFMFIAGIFLLAAIPGTWAAILVERRLKGVKMPDDIKDHIVICNWNNREDKIITELQLAEPKIQIVVVADSEAKINEKELRENEKDKYKNIFFKHGELTKHETLENTNIKSAKSVIILADENSKDPDAKTVLIVLTIKELLKDKEKKPHIIVEALDPRMIKHLKSAGADEVICGMDYEACLLAQCALNKGFSEIYGELLSYKTGNETYVIEGDKFPKVLIGKTFSEATKILGEHRDAGNPVILIGVRRGNKYFLNPTADKFDKFTEGDALVVIAYELPDLSKVVK